MSATATVEIEDTEIATLHADDFSKSRMLSGVLVMSLASLLLELSLTRLFSVTLFYHFAFLAISIALLGLGAGGVCAYLLKDRLAGTSLPRLGQVVCVSSAALMVVVLIIDLNVPVHATLDFTNLFNLTIIYLVSSLPFALTGFFFSVLFARKTNIISQLYAADLIGGAAAARRTEHDHRRWSRHGRRCGVVG